MRFLHLKLNFQFLSLIGICFHVPDVQYLNSSERTSFFSLLTSGSAFGTLLTGVLGSFILDYFGWQMAFRAIGFLGIAWALMMRFYTMSSDRNRVINVSLPNRLCATNVASDSVPWLLLFRRSPFWAMVIAHACQNNCFYVLLSWLPTYFHEGFPHAKVRGVLRVSKIVSVPLWMNSEPICHLRFDFTGLDCEYGAMVGSSCVHVPRKIYDGLFNCTRLAGDAGAKNCTKLLFFKRKHCSSHHVPNEKFLSGTRMHDCCNWYERILKLFWKLSLNINVQAYRIQLIDRIIFVPFNFFRLCVLNAQTKRWWRIS